ncbi:hypothetical protein P7L53_03665 [Thermoleptolyngbya sichuanensis XZ-Cy5]|uniref:hypothetical protein n=1 Tax=Thermoleptolyngbya sichuanensis TaxID=2885951 RepID=UPI00240D3FD5|nr:hypothetical protein [Thermoleptolyngbya sichuanensis]MDG2615333.1 hypothetical protein [Thermoleptolyngbya sichuanensis XZ-Cy5]
MRLELVAIEVHLGDELGELQTAIAQALLAYGEPLRWAVTRVEGDSRSNPYGNRQLAHVEAIVIVPS